MRSSVPFISPQTDQKEGGNAYPGQGDHIDSMMSSMSAAGHACLSRSLGVSGTVWMEWIVCFPLSTPRLLLMRETSLYSGVRSILIVEKLYGGMSAGM
eukprot:COSAG01_NODE_723_length_14060_cov_132.571807_14_plen_98_part_00